MELFADGNRGVYVPQHFAESVNRGNVEGVTESDYAILADGPDHDLYWETWDRVLNNCRITTPDGVWTLHQDGDLWVVHESHVWEEESHK